MSAEDVTIDWQDVAQALDKRLTETMQALADAAMSDFGAVAGVQWEHWRSLTGFVLPEWREVCALRAAASER